MLVLRHLLVALTGLAALGSVALAAWVTISLRRNTRAQFGVVGGWLLILAAVPVTFALFAVAVVAHNRASWWSWTSPGLELAISIALVGIPAFKLYRVYFGRR